MTASRSQLRFVLSALLTLVLLSSVFGCTKIVTKEVPKETGVLVTLSSTEVNPVPSSGKVSKTTDSDHVRWVNNTSQTLTLKFTVAWPFTGPQADIVIAAGAKSPWFTVDPNAMVKAFPYHVSPQLAPQTPPGEPDIDVGP